MGRSERYFILRSGGGVVNVGELAEDLFEFSVVGVGLQGGFAGAESGEIEGVAAGALGCGEGAYGGAGHEVQLMGA